MEVPVLPEFRKHDKARLETVLWKQMTVWDTYAQYVPIAKFH